MFRSASYFVLDRCSNWRSSLCIEIQGKTFAFTFVLLNTGQMLASVVDTMLAVLCNIIYCFLEGLGWGEVYGVLFVINCSYHFFFCASGRLCFVSVAFPVNFHLYFRNTVDNKFEHIHT